MNLQSMLGWAQRILTVLNDPTLIPPSFSSDERLQAKFAWLTEYRNDVQLWCSWLAITDASLDLVRRGGYCEDTRAAIAPLLAPHCDSDQKRKLTNELIVRVEYECSKVPSGRRMAGTTEILESSYGKLKIVEGSQSKSGFTSLVLVWAALFGTTTMDTIKAAMVTTPTKLVHRWVSENLGLTVQSKRTQLARILRPNLTEKQQDTQTPTTPDFQLASGTPDMAFSLTQQDRHKKVMMSELNGWPALPFARTLKTFRSPGPPLP